MRIISLKVFFVWVQYKLKIVKCSNCVTIELCSHVFWLTVSSSLPNTKHMTMLQLAQILLNLVNCIICMRDINTYDESKSVFAMRFQYTDANSQAYSCGNMHFRHLSRPQLDTLDCIVKLVEPNKIQMKKKTITINATFFWYMWTRRNFKIIAYGWCIECAHNTNANISIYLAQPRNHNSIFESA